MNDPLADYLHDHLAGATLAIDLLEDMREEFKGEPLGQLADELLVEIKEDRETLRKIAEEVGGDRSDSVKEAIAWIGEKVTRVKLRRGSDGGLGTLLSLETLAAGIHGKVALWNALEAVAEEDYRLRGMDFDALAVRAQAQRERVETYRLKVARAALGATTMPQ